VLLFTSQGRYSDLDSAADPNKQAYGIDRGLLAQIVAGLHTQGYGYAAYPGHTDYGVTMIHPAWFQQRMLYSKDFLQILFQEKGWDNHQDVYGFARLNVLETRHGPL
jgi:hypothetical protein